MVMVLDTQLAVNPAGKPAAVPIPEAPPVTSVISVITESRHTLDAGAALTVFSSTTEIVPVAFIFPQPPVRGIV
jgi:hypothetical protein